MRIITVFTLLCSLVAAQDLKELNRRLDAMQHRHEQEITRVRTEYEARISALEKNLVPTSGDSKTRDELASSLEGILQDVGRGGLSDFSQTTIFDNTFNPAISVTGDFLLSLSNRDDSFESDNQFTPRSVEVGFAGRVDPLMAYFVVLHANDEEIELEEAFGLVDEWLPSTFQLKWGRYNVDFGKQSPIHDHDLHYIDKPGVLQEFVGGSMRTSGLELHHDFGIGDSTLFRWSLGIGNGLDGDAHVINGPLAGEGHSHDEEHDAEPFGKRHFDNFAITARATALIEIGEESTFQIGASAAWHPENRQFEHLKVPGGTPDEIVVSRDLEKFVGGIDLTYKWYSPETGRGLTIGSEFLYNRESFLDEETLISSHERSIGVYAWLDYQFGPNWSAGLMGDWFERASDSSKEWTDLGGFVTWRVNEFNRLRFELRYFDDEILDENYFVGMLQWTVILGSHSHGLDF